MPPTEKEKSQKLQEKFQAVLSGLLREEDNKYCADCDAKGPRWASWNLGLFICIRCAGIHRNLGVHISRVKSVNLDQWTAEQVASMQAMGNSKARAIYESNLPESFRRSQTDSAMEQFIRNKYEARKWIAKEWTPSAVIVPQEFKDEESMKDKRKANPNKVNLDNAINSINSKSVVKSPKAINPDKSKDIKLITNSDILGNAQKNESSLLDLESSDVFASKPASVPQSNENELDLFNLGPLNNSNNEASSNLFPVDFLTHLPSSNSSAIVDLTENLSQTSLTKSDNVNAAAAAGSLSKTNDLQDLLIGSADTVLSSPTSTGNKCLDKNSILALYGQGVKTNNTNFSSSNMFSVNQTANKPGFNGLVLNQQTAPAPNFSFNQTSATAQSINFFGQASSQNPNLNNSSNFMSQDLFGNAFSNQNNQNIFSSFNSHPPTSTATSQQLPNIGNTLLTDLWQ